MKPYTNFLILSSRPPLSQSPAVMIIILQIWRCSFRFRCGNQQSCDVPVDSTIFGDPCPGTFKYVEVHYACRIGKLLNLLTLLFWKRMNRGRWEWKDRLCVYRRKLLKNFLSWRPPWEVFLSGRVDVAAVRNGRFWGIFSSFFSPGDLRNFISKPPLAAAAAPMKKGLGPGNFSSQKKGRMETDGGG